MGRRTGEWDLGLLHERPTRIIPAGHLATEHGRPGRPGSNFPDRPRHRAPQALKLTVSLGALSPMQNLLIGESSPVGCEGHPVGSLVGHLGTPWVPKVGPLGTPWVSPGGPVLGQRPRYGPCAGHGRPMCGPGAALGRPELGWIGPGSIGDLARLAQPHAAPRQLGRLGITLGSKRALRPFRPAGPGAYGFPEARQLGLFEKGDAHRRDVPAGFDANRRCGALHPR